MPENDDVVPADTELDGGEVSEAEYKGSVSEKYAGVTPGPLRDPEQYKGSLTIMLLVLLAVTIIGHYAALMWFEWSGRKTDALTTAYNEALPVVSGLVSSAVTYYFTRELKK